MDRPVMILNRAQVRHVDEVAIQKYGVPGVVLMENAGRGVAETMLHLGIQGPIVIACGKGNNGGDGFVIARQLKVAGLDCQIILCGTPDELRGDAETNFQPLQLIGVPIAIVRDAADVGHLEKTLVNADWIVDALLGTGAAGPLRPPVDGLLARLNRASAKKLAVDIPSGLDCDTGWADEHAFRADHTCTLVAAKPGLIDAGSEPYVGKLHVVHIGVPQQVIEECL